MVLDEITYPINGEWVDIADVVDTIRNRPGHVNIICTGRNAAQGTDRRSRHRLRGLCGQTRIPGRFPGRIRLLMRGEE